MKGHVARLRTTPPLALDFFFSFFFSLEHTISRYAPLSPHHLVSGPISPERVDMAFLCGKPLPASSRLFPARMVGPRVPQRHQLEPPQLRRIFFFFFFLGVGARPGH